MLGRNVGPFLSGQSPHPNFKCVKRKFTDSESWKPITGAWRASYIYERPPKHIAALPSNKAAWNHEYPCGGSLPKWGGSKKGQAQK